MQPLIGVLKVEEEESEGHLAVLLVKEQTALTNIAKTTQLILKKSFAKIIKQARRLKNRSLRIGLGKKEMEMKNSCHGLFEEANKAWEAGEKRRAFKIFLAAAGNGEEDAFNSVGYFFDHGIGVKKDAAKASFWYRRAAMRGNLAGCLNIASLYRDVGNFRRAIFWFKRAYAYGDGSAAYELGKIYLNQRSSVGKMRAKKYLAIASKSKCITEYERVEAKSLLSKMGRT